MTTTEPTDPVNTLLATLDLQPAGTAQVQVEADRQIDLGGGDVDIFEGSSQPQPHGRAFGGQVLAQCLVAAGRTVTPAPDRPARPVHSLHGYFLRPGDSNRPIRFAVERMRDGNSFSARRVHAIQDANVIMSVILSFQEMAEGLDHQSTMPSAPDPTRLPTQEQDLAGSPESSARNRTRAVDLRHVEDPINVTPGGQAAANQNVWMRVVEELPQDPLIHAAALAYASDYTLLESSLRRHRIAWSDKRLRAASLDHAMWFHRPVRADEWVLYQQESPSTSGGRGLGLGRMFAADGTHVATVAQEGMLRIKPD